MKIIKYKKLMNNRYKVTLDNNIDLTLYEDVILKYNLLISKSIEEKDLDKIKEDNLFYEIYYSALNSLKTRSKSSFVLKKSLLKKEYDADIVDKVIDKLTIQGYLNDRVFCISYINNQMITTNRGPYRIRKELIDNRISEDIINEELIVFTDQIQKERIDKIIDKFIKSNHNKGGFILKNKIINNLINLGYDIDIINKVIDTKNFKVDKELVDKEYNKLYKKLSSKYSGNELEYRIKDKLYKKGLYYEE